MSADDKPPGFTVNDRRIFADEKGTAHIEEAPPASPAGLPGQAGPGDEKADKKAGEARAFEASTGAPGIDFHTFVLSLGSSALLHLGELERPGAAGPEKNLPMAKHTIDILGMLQEKTRGNLTPAEEKLMESLLYDLRLRYVEAKK